jgi:hypothetical protein
MQWHDRRRITQTERSSPRASDAAIVSTCAAMPRRATASSRSRTRWPASPCGVHR